jgi:alcohol dehydrogenase (cytochrome c)
MAPQFVDEKNGLVIVAAAGGEYEVRGQLAAFEADTGKEVWRFGTTDPDSYDGKSWRKGGATVWNTPAIDRNRALVYVTTGNAAPDILGENRAGDNLFATSIVALDLATGEPR